MTIIIRLRRAVVVIVVVVAIVPVTVVVVVVVQLIVLCICSSTYVVRRCISIVYLAPIRFHAYLVVLIGPVELNWRFVAPFSSETKVVHSLGSIN